jgi:hypothetical protein
MVTGSDVVGNTPLYTISEHGGAENAEEVNTDTMIARIR